MIKSLLQSEMKMIDFVPHAIFNRSIESFSPMTGELYNDIDDLDAFTAAYFVNEIGVPIALKHYRGFPANTSSLYFPYDVRDPALIQSLIRSVMTTLSIEADDVAWTRSDVSSMVDHPIHSG